MKKDGMVYTVIFTFIVSFVFVGVLAGVNSVTSERTARNQKLAFQKAVLNALHIKYNNNQQVFDLYNKDIKKSGLSTPEATLYEYNKGEKSSMQKSFPARVCGAL